MFFAFLMACFVGLLLCLISPRWVRWFIPGKPTRLKGVPIFAAMVVLFFVSFGLIVDTNNISVTRREKESKARYSDTVKKVSDTTDFTGILKEDRIKAKVGIGISQKELISKVHTFNQDFIFASSKDSHGVVAKSGQSIIMIIGPKEDVTAVITIVLISPNIFEMVASGIDLVMISDFVSEGSSEWVERMIDQSFVNPKTTLEKRRVFGERLFTFNFEPNSNLPALGLTITSSSLESVYPHTLDEVKPEILSFDEFILMKEIEKENLQKNGKQR